MTHFFYFISRLTFTESSTSTRCPETGVQKCVPLIAGFELDGQAKLVLASWYGVGQDWVSETFEHFLGTGAPSSGLRRDVRGRLVVGLQEVTGIAVGCKIFDHNLIVLSTRLG